MPTVFADVAETCGDAALVRDGVQIRMPAPTTITTNVWSMNLCVCVCVCVELMPFLDWLRLDADLQYSVDAGDRDNGGREISWRGRDGRGPSLWRWSLR